MKKVKLPLFFLSNKEGQAIFLVTGLILILFIFLVIILSNLSITSVQFGYTFRNFISLRSLSISGLRYALYQINQNPAFTTTSASVTMSQGSFIYSVSDLNATTKKITIEANLTNQVLRKILKATATIDSSGTIIDLEVSEE